jgi:hypothetical protein
MKRKLLKIRNALTIARAIYRGDNLHKILVDLSTTGYNSAIELDWYLTLAEKSQTSTKISKNEVTITFKEWTK